MNPEKPFQNNSKEVDVSPDETLDQETTELLKRVQAEVAEAANSTSTTSAQKNLDADKNRHPVEDPPRQSDNPPRSWNGPPKVKPSAPPKTQ